MHEKSRRHSRKVVETGDPESLGMERPYGRGFHAIRVSFAAWVRKAYFPILQAKSSVNHL